ncbi:FAD-dependent oxidoreductase [Gordonia sp. zg691]|nr:FAD-dependent oxidoreductase [Gordonia jinghuaiqii]MBD0863390.1 FAD-dependent oxidoreductase [Gordonia jinghuaiqii]
MRVVIVGAGIAGLCTAAGLASNGAEVTVVERSPEVRGGGSGLSLFGNGLRALEVLGLRSVVPDAPAPVAPIVSGTRRPDGRWLTRFDREALAEMRVVRRTELHEALLGALPNSVEIRTGTGVRDVRDGTVQLDDGTSLECDLVVGADGLRSRVRAAIADDPGVARCGYSAWRAVTSTPVALDAAGETLGRGRRFGIAPLPDGCVYWFASVSDGVVGGGSEGGFEGGLDVVRQQFSGWHAPIAELLDATDPESVGHLPIEQLAHPLPSFIGGRCVLVGDAAHAMTPNLGQGANLAMEDAAVLTTLLARAGTDGVGDAPAVYDGLRRPRTRRIARRASVIGRVGQLRAAPAVWARDLAMRLTPDKVVDAELRRVQNWRPPTT